MADKNWKWPILSERSGQNGLSKLENPAKMADHFYSILATANPCTCFRTCWFNNKLAHHSIERSLQAFSFTVVLVWKISEPIKSVIWAPSLSKLLKPSTLCFNIVIVCIFLDAHGPNIRNFSLEIKYRVGCYICDITWLMVLSSLYA